MTTLNPAGYYHAEGDPPNTVRYWDGAQWIGGPTPRPPAMPTAVVGTQRYGHVGIRIGAAIIDGLILAPLAIIPAIGLLIPIVTVAMIARWGGTPGKLLIGLRITREDGTTTPPGLKPAFKRTLPILVLWICLFFNWVFGFLNNAETPPTAYPEMDLAVLVNLGVSGLIAIIALGLNILNIIFVARDDERRSVHDRIGGTRVVHKDQLA